MELRRQVWILVSIGLADVVLMAAVTAMMVLGKIGVVGTGAAGEAMEPKFAALSFDDGPNVHYTEQLLDGLRERDVKASFFLVGTCIEGNEDMVKRMSEDGHLIGVHGMEHTDLTKESLEDAVMQIRDTKTMITEITGKPVEYIRPPYGNWNEALGAAVKEELELTPVFWDVDSLDWSMQNVGKIVKKVEKNVENGDIILLHDEFSTSVEASFQIIDNLKAKGYTFVTVEELLID